MFPVTPEWEAVCWKEPSGVTIIDGLILYQDKRDAQTGLLDRHNARFAIDGSIEIKKDYTLIVSRLFNTILQLEHNLMYCGYLKKFQA